MGCRTVFRRRTVGLIVEPELHLIAENLVRRCLVLVQQQVPVVTAAQTSLVSLNPAGGIFLLNQITFVQETVIIIINSLGIIMYL